MQADRRKKTRIRPVPGVSWRSHMGCGALLGAFAGLFYVLREVHTPSPGQMLLGALAGAAVFGLLAAALRNRFWIR